MTACTDQVLTCPALLKTDFAAQKEACHKLGEAFTHGNQVHLTSEKGTDLRFSIEGRKANVLTGISNRASWLRFQPLRLMWAPLLTVNSTLIQNNTQLF